MDCGLRRRDVELIETLEHRGKRYPQVTTCAHRPAAREHRRRRPSLFGLKSRRCVNLEEEAAPTPAQRADAAFVA
jgi:hypothetical protein